MGLFDIFRKPAAVEKIAAAWEPMAVCQPVDGTVIPLREIGDGVFSEGVLGSGCGVKPTGEQVFSPISGIVTTIAQTRHAVGLISDDGIKMLVHVGIDTIAMNGRGFHVRVREGDRVVAGQLLLTFRKADIAAAGYSDTTAVLITNSDDYQEVTLTHTGTGMAGEKLLAIR